MSRHAGKVASSLMAFEEKLGICTNVDVGENAFHWLLLAHWHVGLDMFLMEAAMGWGHE